LISMSDQAIGTASALQGSIRWGANRLEYRTSFSSGLRFRCLPECGLCCRMYRIPLTESDLVRLKQVVDPEACSTIAFEKHGQGGGLPAFMENGKGKGCCYLDEDALCSVYGNRPLYCRTYPLIRDTYEGLEMSVDHTCPGVGEGDPVTAEQIEEAFLQEGKSRPEVLDLTESSANYRVICSSLKAMGVYTDAALIRSVCAELIRCGLTSRRSVEILSYLHGAAAALTEVLAESGNITDPEAAIRLVEGVKDILDRSPATNAWDGGTRPGDAGRSGAGGQDAESGGQELSQGAAAALADYLVEWIRRQALLRFVHATALARPRRENVLRSFFAFLAHGACEILTAAERLRRQEEEQKVTARMMRAAIRENESPLRSRCASVVSRY
jgi:Fe-S-cluster containining protein